MRLFIRAYHSWKVHKIVYIWIITSFSFNENTRFVDCLDRRTIAVKKYSRRMTAHATCGRASWFSRISIVSVVQRHVSCNAWWKLHRYESQQIGTKKRLSVHVSLVYNSWNYISLSIYSILILIIIISLQHSHVVDFKLIWNT